MYRISITCRETDEVLADPEVAAKVQEWVDDESASTRDWAEGLDGVDEVEVSTEVGGYSLKLVGNTGVPDLELTAGGEAEDPEEMKALADEARAYVQGLEHCTEAHGEFGPVGTIDLLGTDQPGGAVSTGSTGH